MYIYIYLYNVTKIKKLCKFKILINLQNYLMKIIYGRLQINVSYMMQYSIFIYIYKYFRSKYVCVF
jgi:hypothetical protein